jgi:hypothetical protein
MPVYSRLQLRQSLGQDWLRDTIVSTTTSSVWGVSGSINVVDSRQADPSLSSEGMYQRAWIRVAGQNLRVATFNTGSGAFLSAMLGTIVASGAEYELHQRVSPDEKDRVLTDVARSLRFRQEVTLPSVDGLTLYSLPDSVLAVFDVRYFADPTNSMGRSERTVPWFKVVPTGSGSRELRIAPSLGASQTLVIDAVFAGSLGTGDTATINLPDDEWLLAGAAARCYSLLERDSPGKEAERYGEHRSRMNLLFARKQATYRPAYDYRIQLDEPF